MKRLEGMREFFAARADVYDEHMLRDVEGCAGGYSAMAELLPADCSTLLDLGCGSGLELDFIFRRFPLLDVTGIDLVPEMLSLLRGKHPDKKLRLICGDYFLVDFGAGYDAAVSFQSLHHFSPECKEKLFRKIYSSITPGGVYIEGDYMVDTQQKQDELAGEYLRLTAEQGLDAGLSWHFDTPLTVANETELLRLSGFNDVRHVRREGNTSVLIARK